MLKQTSRQYQHLQEVIARALAQNGGETLMWSMHMRLWSKEVLKSYKFREENISIIYLLEKHDKILISTVFLIVTMQKQVLTNFSGHGKSNNLTMPKSSPVTRLIPE